ncbi:hypothetical protein [Actinomadura spongiicola]|uniref:hypothetical protein n=1 Tax=Actinomadura spongiicola TaxID=2303421 RepID=UPI0011C11A0F|nr:hypothetical protein [Actinomadura spongiicola]
MGGLRPTAKFGEAMYSQVLHANKKPIWQSALGALGLAALMLSLTVLSVIYGWNPVIGMMSLLFFFFLFLGGLSVLSYAYNPLEFRVDDGAMEVRAKGRTTRILWTQLEEVRIVPAPAPAKGEWLMAWPKQAPIQLPKRVYQPEWKAEHAGVKVCELDTFKVGSEVFRAAVQRSAGTLWNESTSMR